MELVEKVLTELNDQVINNGRNLPFVIRVQLGLKQLCIDKYINIF